MNYCIVEELVSCLIERRGLTHFRLAEAELGKTRLYLHFNRYDPKKSLRNLIEVPQDKALDQMTADVKADFREAWKRQRRFEQLPEVHIPPMPRFTPKPTPLPQVYIDAEIPAHGDFISELADEMKRRQVFELHVRKK